MKTQSFEGNIIDVVNKEIFPGVVTISNGYIKSLERKNKQQQIHISWSSGCPYTHRKLHAYSFEVC